MTHCFFITTYGRQESCQGLVDSLQGLGDIFVLSDGAGYNIWNCEFYFFEKNYGKREYYKTVNALWALPKKDYDYYWMIPDDFLPINNFVKETLDIWRNIYDRNKICLNLYRDGVKRERCWTNFNPIEFKTYRKTQWVDMCFFAEKRFFKVVGKIPKQNYNWDKHPHISSGVGSWISRKLNKEGYGLFQANESIFISQPEHQKSQMHR